MTDDLTLDRFVDVIAWRGGTETLSIFSRYTDTLAQRFVDMVGRLRCASERDAMVELLTSLDETYRNGVVVGLTWPPVAAMLLGHRAGRWSLRELQHLLATPGDLDAITAKSVTIPEPAWFGAAGPGHPLTGKEWHRAAEMVDDAWGLVDRMGEAVSALARAHTRAVVLRGSDPGQIGSWSTDELVGCTVLVNAHTAAFDVATIAEAIVHEAVHHTQGMFETQRSLLRAGSTAAATGSFPSPWTGRALTPKSLLAACFVWYSIASLWASVGDAVEGAVRVSHLSRAANGFVSGNPAQTVEAFASLLEPDVLPTIHLMQAEIRSRASSDLDRSSPTS